MTAKLKAKVCLLNFLLLLSSIFVYAQDSDCKSVEFRLPQNYKTGIYPGSFISADVNGDGKVDVIMPNFNAKAVSIMLGDGAGGFAPPQNFAAEIGVSTIAAGDLNRDGKLDLVAAENFSNRMVVLLNDGQGGFPAQTVVTLPSGAYEFQDLKIGDFNGDKDFDVVGVTKSSLILFLGNGEGGLSLRSSIFWSGYRSEIALGNFNNDNNTDLAVITGDEGFPWEVAIVLGPSNGELNIINRFPVGNKPSSITAGEFNGDGNTDLVVAANYPYQNSTPPTYFLQPWFGNGNSGFAAGEKINLPFKVATIAAGDFDDDGKLDLAGSLGSMFVTVNGAGDGTFNNQTYWTAPSSDRLVSADVNKDGRDDLLGHTTFNPSSHISVILAKSSGFTAGQAIPYGTTNIEAADFNNDGYNDYVTAFKTDFLKTSEVVIALNNQNGGFLPDKKFKTPASLKAFKTGDFNGDGKKDAITAHGYTVRKLAVFLGNGSGSVADPVLTSTDSEFLYLTVGDFNSDDKDDVFAVDHNGRAYSLLSNGDGTFTTAPNFPVELPTSYAYKLDRGDFNRDGKLDLVVAVGSDPGLWLGDGNGQFTKSANAIPQLEEVVIGDFNGDGSLDLAGFADGGVKAVLGDGNGEFNETFSQDLAGPENSLIAGDFNSDNSDDLAFVSLNDPHKFVVVVSSGQAKSWRAAFSYPTMAFGNVFTTGDFNADNKPDLVYSQAYFSRTVIYNESGSKPCLSIEDATVTEGDAESVTADFTVSLSEASKDDVFVSYSLESQNAVLGTDLQNTSGRLKIPAGQTTGSIAVKVTGDLLDEFDETFLVHLTSPGGAVLQKADAVGKIADNDAEPSLTISDVTMAEGYSWQSFNFLVNLSAPSGKPISFRYSTSDGTAIGNGKDYASVADSTLNIPAGTTSGNIYISVLGETMYEPEENFFVNLSQPVNVSITDNQALGTIINDDQIPVVYAYSNNIVEGDTGTNNFTVNVQLSNPTYLPVSFNLLTSDGTAIGGKDYKATDNVVTVAAEQMTATTEIQVLGDTVNEPHENFFVNIYNTVNATVTNPQTQFVIFDDEFISNDYDRDGRTDLAVFRPGDKNWYILYSSTGSFGAVNYGLSSDKPVSGDYNGDGRTDIAVFRPENGTWYTPVANRTQQWGANEDIPVPGDYDNDGKIDVAVFRPAAQSWYIQLSSNGAYNFVRWGLPTDKPVPADYDGDGKTDIAVYRPETGNWYILRSSDDGFASFRYGISTDKPVPADYDGDGKADIAVFRDGNWYVLRSSGGNTMAFRWGVAGDKPVPGNYDGDDKMDFAVYRDGTWYIWQSSTDSFVTKQFGLPDDLPIAFVSNN